MASVVKRKHPGSCQTGRLFVRLDAIERVLPVFA